jgi:hypothetical protein
MSSNGKKGIVEQVKTVARTTKAVVLLVLTIVLALAIVWAYQALAYYDGDFGQAFQHIFTRSAEIGSGVQPSEGHVVEDTPTVGEEEVPSEGHVVTSTVEVTSTVVAEGTPTPEGPSEEEKEVLGALQALRGPDGLGKFEGDPRGMTGFTVDGQPSTPEKWFSSLPGMESQAEWVEPFFSGNFDDSEQLAEKIKSKIVRDDVKAMIKESREACRKIDEENASAGTTSDYAAGGGYTIEVPAAGFYSAKGVAEAAAAQEITATGTIFPTMTLAPDMSDPTGRVFDARQLRAFMAGNGGTGVVVEGNKVRLPSGVEVSIDFFVPVGTELRTEFGAGFEGTEEGLWVSYPQFTATPRPTMTPLPSSTPTAELAATRTPRPRVIIRKAKTKVPTRTFTDPGDGTPLPDVAPCQQVPAAPSGAVYTRSSGNFRFYTRDGYCYKVYVAPSVPTPTTDPDWDLENPPTVAP